MKNIKMKPPVALFKKKSRKLCLFLKPKVKLLPTQLYVVCMRREKTVETKICKVRVFFKKIVVFLI